MEQNLALCLNQANNVSLESHNNISVSAGYNQTKNVWTEGNDNISLSQDVIFLVIGAHFPPAIEDIPIKRYRGI